VKRNNQAIKPASDAVALQAVSRSDEMGIGLSTGSMVLRLAYICTRAGRHWSLRPLAMATATGCFV